jgi:predicted metal-dependent hydrolase
MKRAEGVQLKLPLVPRGHEATARAHLTLGGTLVTYTVRRSSRRRSSSIVIDERGVQVGVPWGASEQAIERLLSTHADWVLRKLAQWNARRPSACTFCDGEALMLLGRTLRLTVVPPREPAVSLADARLLVADADRAHIARSVIAWLRHQALACFEDRVDHYRQLIDVAAPHVLLSSARTRWGSCHASGRIHLNWHLIQMPVRLIDYVVAHEVAHLIEMNHSQRFWSTVARIVPDYAERRAELRSEGQRYLLV